MQCSTKVLKKWELSACIDARTSEDIKFDFLYNAVADKIAACYPLSDIGRVYNQHSAFTVHNSLQKIDEKYGSEYDPTDKLLYTIKIPHSCKKRLHEQLALCCITKSFIYPDIENISKDINNKYKGIRLK